MSGLDSKGNLPRHTAVDYDYRFPSTNRTGYCWARYNEFLLCATKVSPDHPACVKLKRAAISFCPVEWIENWNEQRAEGRFPGVQANDVAFYPSAEEEE